MTELSVKQGTPICWANSSDYDWKTSGIMRTHQINLQSLANGDMWQGVKADLGANRPAYYAVKVCFKPTSAPGTAGVPFEVYWSSSVSPVPAVGNDGGAESTGADEDWDGVSGGVEAERDEYKRHLTYVGSLYVGADAVSQVALINPSFTPPTRYGFPIVKNKSGVAAAASAADMYIALIPGPDDVALV